MSYWTQTKWDIWNFYVSNGAKTQPWQNTAYVVGTEKNGLNETVLFSTQTQHIF